MHLLMEAAIGDSQQFQIVSQEETDAIKKEMSILTTQIDGTKRKLVLETKLRDAAQSLNRLHEAPESIDGSPKPVKRHRRSVIGSRGSLTDMLNKTDDELAVSARKCDDLAHELWGLEKRAEVLQKRLLEHTAGVLQRTHKGFLEKELPHSRELISNGHSNRQDLCPPFDLTHEFDDGGFFPTLDSFLDRSLAHANVRIATKCLDFSQQSQAIAETERKLEDLNNRLRESIAQFGSPSHPKPASPAREPNNEEDSVGLLDEQLTYLMENFSALQESHSSSVQAAKRSIDLIEERLRYLNSQLQGLVTRTFSSQNSEYPLPPEVTGQGAEGQVDYLEVGLDAVAQGAHRLIEHNNSLSSRSTSNEGEFSRYNAILLGLWEILLGGEEEVRRQDPIQREVHGEDFSIQAFSAKIQTLYARATALQEQKEILARQVQQQRELNSQSDPQKDTKISDLSLELEHAKRTLTIKEIEAKEAGDNLVLMTERIDALRQEASLSEQQKGVNQNRALEEKKETRKEDEERLYEELEEKQQQVADLENELAETKDDFGISRAEMLGKLEESDKRVQSLDSELQSSRNEKDKFQSEMRELEGQVVLLQTELTVARAELDGAYGTRAQRAAEQASNPAIQQEFEELTTRNKGLAGDLEDTKARYQAVERANADLNQRMQTLQRELMETIGEYEAMTKASIEFEREREQLENNLDALRERCETVESQLSEEKVRWLGVTSPGSTRDSISPGTTSTQVLKNEFKKMMRDTRAENMRALRVSLNVSISGPPKLTIGSTNKKSAGSSKL